MTFQNTIFVSKKAFTNFGYPMSELKCPKIISDYLYYIVISQNINFDTDGYLKVRNK